MKASKIVGLALVGVLSLGVLAGCGSKDGLKDGAYKAEASDFDSRGWKPFVELTVKDKKISDVKFDYVNKEGKMKSADEAYNKSMMEKAKTSPSIYTKDLAKKLVETQDVAKVDTITGATTSTGNFKALAEKAIADGAKTGKTDVIKVKIEEKK